MYRSSPGCWGAPQRSVSPDIHLLHEAVVDEEARRQKEDKGTEADHQSEIVSVGGPLSIVGKCESEGVTFEQEIGRAGLFSETDTALDTPVLPLC